MTLKSLKLLNESSAKSWMPKDQSELEKQLQQDAEAMASAFNPDKEKLQELVLRPKKADINVRWSGLLWAPYWHLEAGGLEAAF